jgi:ABC-type lipoprotein release transport system permease subunit
METIASFQPLPQLAVVAAAMEMGQQQVKQEALAVAAHGILQPEEREILHLLAHLKATMVAQVAPVLRYFLAQEAVEHLPLVKMVKHK